MTINKRYRPVVLIILDGWGIAPSGPGNAVTQAKTPNINSFLESFPRTKLQASGEAVGLPRGEAGNSEAGHLNLGAGRIIYQDLPRINMSIADGSFFTNKAFFTAINHANKNKSSLHLLGLIGAGGVHSNIEHIFALLRFCKEQGQKSVFFHFFTDGRDSPPTSALEYLKTTEEKIKHYNVGQIATLIGRFYAMDRDNRWERTKIAYDALTLGKGVLTDSYAETISDFYRNGKTDEFLEPIIIKSTDGKPVGLINDNDAVVFFNYRIDRPRQLTKAFILSNFENLSLKKKFFDPYAEKYGQRQYEQPEQITTFKREKVLKNLLFITMTQYEPELPTLPAFPPVPIKMPLARVIAENNFRQFHIAETEKERHVTYYFNGKREDLFPGEDRVEIPSPKVTTYDLKPEMSAFEVTETLINRIKLRIYDFIVVNFANPDMVGHTGILKAGIKACEVTDQCLGMVVRNVLAENGICLVTADHGNVEEMINLTTGRVDTEHSISPVPFIIIGNDFRNQNRFLPSGILADVAPMILKFMGIEKPGSMTGKALM